MEKHGRLGHPPLQPSQLTAAYVPGGIIAIKEILNLCYDFHAGVSPGCGLPTYTSGDNGNVFQVVNTVDTTSLLGKGCNKLHTSPRQETAFSNAPE